MGRGALRPVTETEPPESEPAFPKRFPVEPTERLVEAARAGDGDAWAEVDARCRPALMAKLHGQVPDAFRRHFDTEQIVHSGLTTAYLTLGTFEPRGKSSFRHWVRRVTENVRNKLLRHHRADKRDAQKNTSLAACDPDEAALVAGATPLEESVKLEEHLRLRAALARLPEAQRRVVELRVVEQVPLAEVARGLGVSAAAAGRLLRKALARLERELRP